MLTKQEREEIAERFRNYDKAEYVTLYSGMYDGLLGEHVPKETTVKKDRMELASRILELCDTSNMLELPVDKDGEYIHINDTVYDEYSRKCRVICVSKHETHDRITLQVGPNNMAIDRSPNAVTHREPLTIKELASRIRGLLNENYRDIPDKFYDDLWSVSRQIESLGDSDD